MEGHERIDRMSLALHRACAQKLRTHPELLAIARDNLDRWSKLNSRSQPYFDKWRELLDLPLDQLLNLMVEETEQMTALRHASPFAGVLNIAERRRILRQ